MPTCSINIQPDCITAKLAIQVPQHLEEAFPVAPLRLDYTGTAQKRSNPAGNIQSFLMLAGCGNLQPLSDERPAPAKPRMQGKAAFVLKNNGFFRPQRFEFFLAPSRTSSRLRLSLGETHDWPSSFGNRDDASSTAPGEPSALPRSAVVSGLPASDRPNELGSGRTSGAIAPDGVPTAPQFLASSGLGVQAAFSGSGLQPRPCSPPASSGSRSCGFGQELRISSPAAALRALRAGWRSLCRSTLPELSRPGPTASLLKPYADLRGRYSCPQYNTTTAIM
jgi:hypothetical protein